MNTTENSRKHSQNSWATSISRRPSHQPNPQRQRRLILYARKSTESEDRQVQSIEDQIRLDEDKARQEGFAIEHVIQEARSAKEQGTRPGFRQMVALIENGEADGIVCWHPDRLARNSVDGGWILDLLDRGKLKYLLFASSYTFENTPEGKFMLGMIFTQSKYYVDKLSKDVLRGMNSKREKGHFPHRAPEGYINNIADKTIEADPLRFPLLRQAIDLILSQTLRPSQVLSRLNDEWGYRTLQRKTSGGKALSRTSFYDLLGNPFYYGMCQEKDHSGIIITYPGSHPPLLSRGEFDRVQQILGKSEKPMAQKHAFALTGLIRCGRCECMITATRSKGHVYYHCSNSKKICDRRGIREEDLMAQATAILDHLELPEFAGEALLSAVKRHVGEELGKEQEVSASANRASEAAQRQLNTLLGMRARELITDEEYLLERTRLQEEIDRLRRDEERSDFDMDRAVETAENAIEFAVWARRAFDEGSPDVQRRIVEMLGSRFVLTGKNLLLDLNPLVTFFDDLNCSDSSFKPSENGSESTKRTDDFSSVLHGWASRTAVKLLRSVRGAAQSEQLNVLFSKLPGRHVPSTTVA